MGALGVLRDATTVQIHQEIAEVKGSVQRSLGQMM